MRAVLKASVICWGVVVAFFVFFLIPFDALGAAGAAALSMSVGAAGIAWLGLHAYRLHREEGFDFGLFLVRRYSFWRLFAGVVGLALFLVGALWFLAPRAAWRRLEAGAMPLAALLVVLFWFSLIFTFLGFAVVCYAQSVGYLRVRGFKTGAGSFAVALLFLALATLFCSLFLEVINDNFLSLSAPAQKNILVLFALGVTAAGLCAGARADLEKLLPEEEIRRHDRG